MEKALDADLDTHIHLRRVATFVACMLNDSHTSLHTHTKVYTRTHPCSFLSPNWPPVKISLILWGLYFLLAGLG